jgi:hypothetical protein
MPRSARVVTGRWVEIPFTLRHRGQAPRQLDFSGGSVVYAVRVEKANRAVSGAPCGILTVLPPSVRLTVPAGGAVRGTIAWKASTFQADGMCEDLARDLSPGRYRVTFATISGEPPLAAAVDVKVTRR